MHQKTAIKWENVHHCRHASPFEKLLVSLVLVACVVSRKNDLKMRKKNHPFSRFTLCPHYITYRWRSETKLDVYWKIIHINEIKERLHVLDCVLFSCNARSTKQLSVSREWARRFSVMFEKRSMITK